MKVLFLETNMGASGDMLLGALSELLPNKDEFLKKLNNIGLENVTVQEEKRISNGISGNKITVKIGDVMEGEDNHKEVETEHEHGEHSHSEKHGHKCCGKHHHVHHHGEHHAHGHEGPHVDVEDGNENAENKSEYIEQEHEHGEHSHGEEHGHKCCGKHHHGHYHGEHHTHGHEVYTHEYSESKDEEEHRHKDVKYKLKKKYKCCKKYKNKCCGKYIRKEKKAYKKELAKAKKQHKKKQRFLALEQGSSKNFTKKLLKHDKFSHRDLNTLGQIIDTLDIDDKIKTQAKEIYQIIASAESKVHGTDVSQIHFHEVGELDAVMDIVGVCLAIDEIKPDRIVSTPIHVGSGKVKTAHGKLPVPTPATSEILLGVPIYSKKIKGELCTPTGAALLKYFVNEYTTLPMASWEKVGYGLGEKEFDEPNILRAFIGEEVGR